MNKLFSLAVLAFFLYCNLPTDSRNNHSNDLSLSKDSLKVHHKLVDTCIDRIIIKNNSDNSIILDSAFLRFDIVDSTSILNDMEAHWVEDMYGDFGWFLKGVGKNNYKLVKKFFSPGDTATPLHFSPKGSVVLLDLQIGSNLVSQQRPVLIKLIKGTFQLYFSNKQFLEIKLYSDD